MDLVAQALSGSESSGSELLEEDLSDLFPDEEVENVIPFMSDRKTTMAIKNEKPWHRTAAWLYAAGHGRDEIANAVGKTPTMISVLLQQPFFRQRAAEFLQETGLKKGLQQQIAQIAPEAFATLAGLLNSNNENLKFKASVDLLDRALGKAPQVIKREADNGSDNPLEESRKLDQEIARSLEVLKGDGMIVDVKTTKIA